MHYIYKKTHQTTIKTYTHGYYIAITNLRTTLEGNIRNFFDDVDLMTDSCAPKKNGKIEQKGFIIASDKKTSTKAVHVQNTQYTLVSYTSYHSPYTSFTVESKSIYGHVRTLGT